MYQYRIIHVDDHNQVIGDESPVPGAAMPNRVILSQFLNEAGKQFWRVVTVLPTAWNGAKFALLLEKSQGE